jgi:hypothetical protein
MTEGAVVRGARAVVVLVVGGVLTAGLVGCTSSAKEPPGLTASPTVSVTPTPEPTDDTAVVEAAILEVYYRYWDATVAAQRGNPDPTLFADNTRGQLVEEKLAQARQYQEYGIVREGEPSFSNVSVEVEGDRATVLACVDNSTWIVPGVEDDLPDVLPGGLLLEQIDGAWLVTDRVEAPADFTC